MANYFGNLIQRTQATDPVIRPVVAPLFAPNANALDLSSESAPLSLEEEVSPALEMRPVRARRVSRNEEPHEATNDRIDAQSARPRVTRYRPSETQPIDVNQEVSERPQEVSKGPDTVPSVSTHGAANSMKQIETRTIENVIQTRVLNGQSDPPQDHSTVRTTAVPPKALASPSEAIRPRIEPFVPPTNSSRDRGRVDLVEAESNPTIRVTIGRVDVKLVTAEPAKRPAETKQEPKPTLALEDYLARTGDQR
jgi:hypothetical protein